MSALEVEMTFFMPSTPSAFGFDKQIFLQLYFLFYSSKFIPQIKYVEIQKVQKQIGTLSFSELEAIIHIFEELDGNEGILVASKIADRVGITRSVIVNALRKFESAGVIESRSSGMKGTYIKVLNDVVFEELEKRK